MEGIELTADSWLSDRLAKPAYHLNGTMTDAMPAAIFNKLTEESVFVDAKIATESRKEIQFLERHCFQALETNVQLSCQRNDLPRAETRAVGFATPEMRDVIGAIAECSFSLDRFHCDPKISGATANRIKGDWARNYFAGSRGEWMVVAMESGSPVGFLQLLRSKENDLVIDLIAVDGGFRGRGLARAMILFAVCHCDASGLIKVGTQLGNVTSMRLYKSLGFVPTSSQQVFHHHGRDQ
jgi:ribosomal protein S18 acetylase RimI-like enzyme